MGEHILTKSKEKIIEYVMDEYGEEIKRVIYTYVKSYAQADDIFQDVLIKVYKTIDTFEGKSTLKTWLYRIATNKCKDYLRSPIQRFFSYQDDTSAYQMIKSAEQLAISNEQQTTIVNAILSLPIKYREVFVLKFYQSFTIKQISDALDVKESTVKTRIMRGKKKLQQKLGGDFLEKYE